MKIIPFHSLEGRAPWEFQKAGQDTGGPLTDYEASDDSDTYLPSMGVVPQEDQKVWGSQPDPWLEAGEPAPVNSHPGQSEENTTTAVGGFTSGVKCWKWSAHAAFLSRKWEEGVVRPDIRLRRLRHPVAAVGRPAGWQGFPAFKEFEGLLRPSDYVDLDHTWHIDNLHRTAPSARKHARGWLVLSPSRLNRQEIAKHVDDPQVAKAITNVQGFSEHQMPNAQDPERNLWVYMGVAPGEPQSLAAHSRLRVLRHASGARLLPRR